MPQRLHLVFGGVLKDPAGAEFRKPEEIDIVGIFPDRDSAMAAWKSAAYRTVDDAHMRYFVVDLHTAIAAGVTAG